MSEEEFKRELAIVINFRFVVNKVYDIEVLHPCCGIRAKIERKDKRKYAIKFAADSLEEILRTINPDNVIYIDLN